MTFIRQAWYAAGFVADFPTGAVHAVQIATEPLALWRGLDGRLLAFEDRCPHRMAPLSKGRIEQDRLRCMYHGLAFDTAGLCVEVPGQPQPTACSVRSFPVVEQDGWVWVWMGDPACANLALVPPAVAVSDERWLMYGRHMDYVANYELINDNLCDFSHLAFLHVNSFGAGQAGGVEAFARRPTVEPLERGIRVTRWLSSTPTPPWLNDVGAAVDACIHYDYLLPGVLLMWSGLYPVGTAEVVRFGKPGPEVSSLHENFTSQAVTPIDDRHTRYHFAWGPSTKENRPFLMDGLMALGQAAFTEDRAMIEAQQSNLDRSAGLVMRPTIHDRGPNLMREVIRRHLAQEAAPRHEHLSH